MVSKEPIREFGGKILGWVETDKDDNQLVRDFYGKILAKYDKKANITRDFYGRMLSKGNTVIGALYKHLAEQEAKQKK